MAEFLLDNIRRSSSLSRPFLPSGTEEGSPSSTWAVPRWLYPMVPYWHCRLLWSGWTVVPLGVYLLASGTARRLVLKWPVIVSCVAVLLCLLFLGSRGFTAEVLLVALAAAGLARRRLSWPTVLVGTLVMFALASVAGYLRDLTVTGESSFKGLIEGGIPAPA